MMSQPDSIKKTMSSNTIIGTVQKKRKVSRLGIVFRQRDRHVEIETVRGKFEQKTDLVPGLRVLQINGTPVDSPEQAALFVRRAPIGTVTVVAHGTCLHATKQRRKQKAGLSLQEKHGRVEIARVDPAGLFPTLKAGQVLVCINRRPVKTVTDGISLLRKKRRLSVVAIAGLDQQEGEDTTTRSSVSDEPQPTERITFQMPDAIESSSSSRRNNEIEAEDAHFEADNTSQHYGNRSVASSSNWSQSELDDNAPGRWSSSNWDDNASSSRWSQSDDDDESEMSNDDGALLASGLLNDLTQELQQAEWQFATRVVASVVKPTLTEASNCGIPLEEQLDKRQCLREITFRKQEDDGGIETTKVSEEGLLGQLGALQVGQRVVLVNGNPCPTTTTLPTSEVVAFSYKADHQVYAPVVGASVMAEVLKPSQTTRAGISLRKSCNINSILIAGIAPEGLFGTSGLLHVGQKIITINGMPCPTSTIDAIHLIQQTVGILSLEAAEVDWSATLERRQGEIATRQEVIPSSIPEMESGDDATGDSSMEYVEEDWHEISELLGNFEAALQNVYSDGKKDEEDEAQKSAEDASSFPDFDLGPTIQLHDKRLDSPLYDNVTLTTGTFFDHEEGTVEFGSTINQDEEDDDDEILMKKVKEELRLVLDTMEEFEPVDENDRDYFQTLERKSSDMVLEEMKNMSVLTDASPGSLIDSEP